MSSVGLSGGPVGHSCRAAAANLEAIRINAAPRPPAQRDHTYDAWLSAYTKREVPHIAWTNRGLLRYGLLPRATTYGTLIIACGRRQLPNDQRLREKATLQHGELPDVVTYNA